jgi:hypothetical protein
VGAFAFQKDIKERKKISKDAVEETRNIENISEILKVFLPQLWGKKSLCGKEIFFKGVGILKTFFSFSTFKFLLKKKFGEGKF